VPLRAASMLKGAASRVRAPENEGGSIRVKGEDAVRRRERMPTRLLFGDLPATAGAVDGVAVLFRCPKGDDGVSRRTEGLLKLVIGVAAPVKTN